jgi:hypothetical protein
MALGSFDRDYGEEHPTAGHTHTLDESLFEPVADHFRAVGKASGNLVDQYAEYDEFSIQHQIPGGMMGTFKAQLAMHKMMDKLPEVPTKLPLCAAIWAIRAWPRPSASWWVSRRCSTW